MNSSFVFYESFYSALRLLSPEEQLEAYNTICRYALYGDEPEELQPGTEIVFTLIRPQIDANSQRRCNGMTGGRPKKEKPSVSNKKTNGFKGENQRLQNQKPNVNVNANGNVNVNANIYTPEFEEIWSHYPRKKEKAAAYKAYKARRKSYSDQELDLAVERYAQECRILGTEEKFIKHGATFFGPSLPFTDYLTKDWRPPEASGNARNTFHNFDQRDYDYDQLEKKLTGAM